MFDKIIGFAFEAAIIIVVLVALAYWAFSFIRSMLGGDE